MGLLALARIAVHVIPLRPVNPLAGTAVPNQPVSFVHMALARIAALVIPILGVPLNVLPVETVVSEKNVTKFVNSSVNLCWTLERNTDHSVTMQESIHCTEKTRTTAGEVLCPFDFSHMSHGMPPGEVVG